VLAREVTALDVVSRGRAAVLLRFGPSASGGGTGVPPRAAVGPGAAAATVAEYLAEAAEICRAVLTEDAAALEGRYLHVAGAVNRPAPVRPGGPPVLVEVPGDWPRVVEESAAGRQSGARLAAAAMALVCRGGRDRLAACRRALDGLLAEGGVAAAAKCAGLLHVAAIGDTDPRATGGAARDGGEVASWRDAGAEGVILQLTPGAPPGEAADPIAEEDRLAGVLGRAVERWSR
jgi:alkanesulfonate monooxygenase SsuD/methylene tetrahydromethanopterin reductase-like flavin-dependent oxidoreductase (luciferase family)